MLTNPKKLVFRLWVGFALTMIAACGGGTKAVRNSGPALIAGPSVCSPLTQPYDACVVADANGRVDRAGLQSLIDQASAQYALRPASLGPIRVTLPGALSYTLDGTLKVKTGVHLVGTGPDKPHLVSVGPMIDVEAWANAARSAAVGFSAPPPISFTAIPNLRLYHRLHCTPGTVGCNAANLTAALAKLDQWIASSRALLCSDPGCGADDRYFDVFNRASLCLSSGGTAQLCGKDLGIPEDAHTVIPAYEYIRLKDEVPDFSTATADPVISIEGPAGREQLTSVRVQATVEDLVVQCQPGPYFPTAGGLLKGFGAVGVFVAGYNDDTVAAPLDDIAIRGVEVEDCSIGIYTHNAHNASILDNQLRMGIEPYDQTTISFGSTSYSRLTLLAVKPELRNAALNGIRIHGTLDRGIRIEGNTIGRAAPDGSWTGPIRGIHVHGTNPGTENGVCKQGREDLVVTKNTIHRAQDQAIDFQGYVEDVVVEDNTIGEVARVFPPYTSAGTYPYHLAFRATDAGICSRPHACSHDVDSSLVTSACVGTSPVIEDCSARPLRLDHYPLGQPPGNRVVVGRTVTFAPPAPSFTDGCSAAIGPDYRLVAQTPAGLILLADFGDDAPLQWTPQASLLGAHTFRLYMRSRDDALAGDPPIAETQAVTIQAVSSLSGSAACTTTPGLSFVETQGTPRIAISPATPVTCTSFTRLEYQLQAHRVGTTHWSTVFGYGPSATFIWNRDSVDPSDQFFFRILYRRQGSNAAFEHSTTPPGQYP